jgi:hypothetical protein
MKVLGNPLISVTGIIINLFLMVFNYHMNNHNGIILSVACIASFIFSYWVHLNEKEKDTK